jgi:ABC-type antimicrobial peptide transport system permease subunit
MRLLFLRSAVIYSLIGISLGIFMGITHDFANKSVHVHANLAGWVSMALFGLIYGVYPAMAQSKLAKIHFWLHNAGMPFMLAGIYGIWHQQAFGEPVVGVGSLLVAIGFVLFAFNLWKNAKE